jgi:hypothetical protein
LIDRVSVPSVRTGAGRKLEAACSPGQLEPPAQRLRKRFGAKPTGTLLGQVLDEAESAGPFLFIELVARDFVESTDEHISALTEDPGPVRPDADVAGAVRKRSNCSRRGATRC